MTQQDTQLTKYAAESTTADALLQRLQAAQITTNADYVAGAEQLKELKAHINRLTAERAALLEPLRVAQQRIQALVDKPLSLYKQAEKHMKAALGAFDASRDSVATALLQEAASLGDAGQDARALAKINDAALTATPDVAGVSYRNTLRVELVNIDLVPRRFLQLDEKAIRKAIREESLAEIPGVLLTEVRTMAVRA